MHPSRPAPSRTSRRPAPATILALATLALAAAACRAPAAARLPFAVPALAADSAQHRVVAEGLAHHAYVLSRLPGTEPRDTLPGPWRVHVLDADRRRCWQPFPYRAGADPSRAPLSALARGLAEREPASSVVAGVNADFFSFAPNGVLQGPHVDEGVVVAGPGDRASAALDSTGRLRIARFAARGLVAAGGDTLAITGWNHLAPAGLALYDAAHGRIDSLRASAIVELAAVDARWRIVRVDSAPPAAMPAVGDGRRLLVLGRNAGPELRARLLAFARTHGPDARPGTPLDTLGVSLAPFHPRGAVGGFGILLRGGEIPATVDSTGEPSFSRARHPRSAVGWDATGNRLLLVAVDGRRAGYSAGMSLRELARTMRALGATDALNLDGGGSTTLVVARSDDAGSVSTETLNRPSDNGGERAIANALMIARRCTR